MIIYIDRTISEYLYLNKLSDTEARFFAELALSHHHGRCFLCGDLISLDALHNRIDVASCSLYGPIINRHAEAKSIIELVESVLVVTIGDKPSVPDFIRPKMRVVRLQEVVENNYDICENCSLVGENLSDCSFYSLIAERFVYQNHIKGVRMAFRDDCGGGDPTYLLFRERVDTNRVLTFCIVDSDIKYGPTDAYPDSPEQGTTLRKIEESLAEIQVNLPIYELYAVPVHEAENLIPIHILETVAEGHPNMTAGVSTIKKLLEVGRWDALLYYDLKVGGSQTGTAAYNAYWNEVGEMINDHAFPAVHKKGLLKLCIEELSEKSKGNIKNVVTVELEPYLDSLWTQIGRKMFSWGCASIPTSA